MKKIIVCIIALVFSVCSAEIEKSSCQIVNLKGSVVYGGDCQNISSDINKMKNLLAFLFF